MTNKEILQADILDILFEKRNKEYGAYALRRGYDQRLLTALVAGLFIIFLFILLTAMNKSEKIAPPKMVIQKVEITNIALKKEKVKEPEKIKEPEKPKQPVRKKQPAVAQAKFTPPVIKEDDKVKDALATQDDMKDKKIGTENIIGKPAEPIVKFPEGPVDNKNSGNGGPQEPVNNFVAQEKDPEFPGGPAELNKFLQNNLRTPEEMEAGERKVVKIQFKVDKD